MRLPDSGIDPAEIPPISKPKGSKITYIEFFDLLYATCVYLYSMKATFIELSSFLARRPDYLTDDEFREFQNVLMNSPTAGNVIAGTGGLRKDTNSRLAPWEGQARRPEDNLLLAG